MTATAILCLFLAPEPTDILAGLRSDDPATRLRAVQQVERLGADGSPDEVYLAPLAGLLRDTDLQTRGLAALGLWRHVSAIKARVPDGVVLPLALGLRDRDGNIAAYCDRTLSAIGARAIPQLRAALAADQPRAQRLVVLDACLRLMARPRARESVDALFWPLLTDADLVVRNKAFLLLQQARAEHSLPPFRDASRLAELLRSPDERLRTLAVQHVIELDEAAFPVLIELLGNRDPQFAETTLLLKRLLELNRVPDLGQTITLLAQLLELDLAGTRELRTILAQTAQVQLCAAWNRFGVALERTFPFVAVPRAAGIDLASGWLTAEVVLALEQNLFARDARRNQIAAEALAAHYQAGGEASTRAIQVMTLALDSSDVDLRHAAAHALRFGLRPPQTGQLLLVNLCKGIISEDDHLRIDCTYALAGCGEPAEMFLLALLQKGDAEAQYRAADAVAIMAHSHGIYLTSLEPHLKRLLDSPDPYVRRAARDSLSALQPRPGGSRP
jgi:hypothetical protein